MNNLISMHIKWIITSTSTTGYSSNACIFNSIYLILDCLKNLIFITEIKSVVKNFPTKKTVSPDGLTSDSTKHLRKK